MMLEMRIFQEIFGEVLFLSPISLRSMFLVACFWLFFLFLSFFYWWVRGRNDFFLQYLVRFGYHSCAFFPLWNHI